MIIVITFAVKERYSGYFASCMNEVSTGVYVSTISPPPFREKLLDTINRWWEVYNEGSINVIWYDIQQPSKINFINYGEPKRELIPFQSLLLTKID
ncbi:MAG: type I-E CRISPR-associated endoribonuclease Cas2 [Richelia sp. RM2_1_2]|nr:type I-E CRISPR-associated endoribonuclease Cas2 [Richelia sp. RM2_1_2]